MEDLPDAILGFFVDSIPILLIILSIVGTVMFVSLNTQDTFETLCTENNPSVIVEDVNYNSKTAFVQIFLDEQQEIEITYPSNTFSIISSLYDIDGYNLDTMSEMGNELSIDKRKKSSIDELSKCFGNACFCHVETEAEFINFDNLEWTWCFPLLYSEARGEFDALIESKKDSSNDLDLFKEVITLLLYGWRNRGEHDLVIACYDSMNQFEFTYEGLKGEFFVTIDEVGSDLLSSGNINLAYDILKELYSISKVGYFPIIKDCSVIPDKNDCLCETGSNLLIHNNEIFFGMCGSRSSSSGPMNFEEIYFSKTAEAFSCMIEIN